MKKTLKKLLIAFIAVLGVASLTSCNHANTYNKFHNNSSNLAKSHVLKEISVGDLKSLKRKIENDKKVDGSKTESVEFYTGSDKKETKSFDGTYIYIFLGTPTNSTASTDAQIFDEQAKQYGISCLYWIDTNLSDSKIEKLNETLGNPQAEITANSTGLISICKEKSSNGSSVRLEFSSFDVKCAKKDGTASGTELTPYQIAQNCFKNLSSINFFDRKIN